MKRNFIKELQWRGMIQDTTPNVEEHLSKRMITAYVGIDPTADSLHIGHLVSIMMLKHFQLAGHKPLVLVGGATGMVGDPSGKSKERNLLDTDTLRHNEQSLKKQLSHFLDFDTSSDNHAEMVNNYDWMKSFSFLDFVRDIGKHISVNYMMSKDSVKKRISEESKDGMSFTEFTYQLLQGYDFLWLYKHKNCQLQMGGSDQWGNITTGIELIRRKESAESWAITCPLITKSNGAKFGKTEEGNIWLDETRTSPYTFYQFWLNTSDIDATRYIKIFTLLNQEEVNDLIALHEESPEKRVLQKKLAEEITCMIHSREAYEKAIKISQVLFSSESTIEELSQIDQKTILSVFKGVPIFHLERNILKNGVSVVAFLSEYTSVFQSKGEAKRMVAQNAISINKQKINLNFTVTQDDIVASQYILIQKGKKNYYLVSIT